jgi:hypothetical protein
MTSVSAAYHLLGALRRAAGRVFLTFFLTLIVVGGATELVHYLVSPPNGVLTHIVAAALGVGWAIALSLLVLVGEVIRGLVTGVRDAAKDVEKEAASVGQFVQGVAGTIDHKDKK